MRKDGFRVKGYRTALILGYELGSIQGLEDYRTNLGNGSSMDTGKGLEVSWDWVKVTRVRERLGFCAKMVVPSCVRAHWWRQSVNKVMFGLSPYALVFETH